LRDLFFFTHSPVSFLNCSLASFQAAEVDEFIKDHKRWQAKALTPEKCDREQITRKIAYSAARECKLMRRSREAVLDQLMPKI
jgi:hypothetical protein